MSHCTRPTDSSVPHATLKRNFRITQVSLHLSDRAKVVYIGPCIGPTAFHNDSASPRLKTQWTPRDGDWHSAKLESASRSSPLTPLQSIPSASYCRLTPPPLRAACQMELGKTAGRLITGQHLHTHVGFLRFLGAEMKMTGRGRNSISSNRHSLLF